MITLRTLFGYLLGRADAARLVATHPRALWIGLVFVLAAGFAREYDGEDLLRDPWHLALPLVASAVTSFVLYLLLRIVSSPNRAEDPTGEPRGFLDGYPALLRLYWWTAPLAFLYAIPVEQMMSPAEATRTNLAFLGVVAAWRVVLITRALAATWRASFWATLFPVMLFADGVAIVMLFIAPLPVFTLMGGVRLTESEALILETAAWMILIGVLSGPVWLIGSIVAGRKLSRRGMARRAHLPEPPGTSAVSRPLLIVCAVALLMWVPILPFTQPSQQRRRAVEEHLLAGQFEDAMRLIKEHKRGEFPAHWDPPPRPGYGESRPDAITVLAVALESHAPYWFASAYVEKLPEAVLGPFQDKTPGLEEHQAIERLFAALPDYPDVERLVRAHRSVLIGTAERLHGKGKVPATLWHLLQGIGEGR